MLDDLESYFRLITTYRKSDALTKRVILTHNLPTLSRAASSIRLKNAISNFIKENCDALQSRSAGNTGT